MQTKQIVFSILMALISIPFNLFAHPGKKDAQGCHYCHSHCEQWGVSQGQKHCDGEAKKSIRPLPSPTSPTRLSSVLRVIDGDTLELENHERVRLIGVDTPETKHPEKHVQYFGQEAAAFTRKLVEGKSVHLEFERKLKDKYGRNLAYVYLRDGTFLNAELIKRGYGFAYTKQPFKYLKEFRELERQARESQAGLWEK